MTVAYGRAVLASESLNVRLAQEGSRSILLSKAAYNLGRLTIACDLDPAEVEAELFDAALVAGLAEGETLATIRASLSRGEQRPRSIRPSITSKDHARAEIARLAEVALHEPWGGHYGRRCITVLTGILTIALDQGAMEVNVPLTRLLLTIGSKNRQQAQHALRNLVDSGWLHCVRHGGPGHPARYRLRFPEHARTQAATTPTPNRCWPDYAETISHLGADAYRPKGLNKTAWRILRHLAEANDWTSQANLARALGISASTVWRHCGPSGRLVRYGLISRSASTRGAVRLSRFARPTSLDQVAQLLGTDGTEARHREDIVRWYVEQGYLTDDMHWIDQRTGEPTAQVATWLLDPTVARRTSRNSTTSQERHEVGPEGVAL